MPFADSPAPPLAVLAPSPLRRLTGVGMLVALGLLLVWVALAAPPAALGWRLFLLGAGGGALWLGEAVRRATQARLELSPEGLRDTAGRLSLPLAEIERVERGTFAFKPSGGFLIRLARPGPRGWAPGLWWRIGRRVGIGGVTGNHQARHMAEMLSLMLAERRP